MLRTTVLAAMLFFLSVGGAGARNMAGGFGIDVIQDDSGKDLLFYDMLYIKTVDTSGVEPDIFNPLDDEGEDDLKRDIAFRTRKSFMKQAERTMPVTLSEGGTEGKRTIELRLSLAGKFRDTSLLENAVSGVTARKVGLSMEAGLYDMKSGELLVSLSDSYEGRIDTGGNLELRLDDLEQWYNAIDFWAAEFTKFLAYKRGTLMPVTGSARPAS